MPEPKIIKLCGYIGVIGLAGGVIITVLVFIFTAIAQPKIEDISISIAKIEDSTKWAEQKKYIDSSDKEIIGFARDAFTRLMFYQQENMTEGEILAAESKYKRFQMDNKP